MAKIKQVVTQASVSRLGEGTEQYLRMLRDGSIGVADFIAVLSLEGRVFTATAGEATSPATFGDGGLDTDEFDLHVAVPASVVIIPLSLNIHFEAFGTASLVECVMQSGSGSVTGAATAAVTAISSNKNSGRTSACTIGEACADGGTALTTNIKEIWRESNQLAITTASVGQIRSPYNYRWNAMDNGVLDVVGPAEQVCIWAAANAGTGFISFKYIELPSSAVE